MILSFKSKLIAAIVLIVFAAICSILFGCQSPTAYISQKNDTSRVWVKYFSKRGTINGIDASKDTEAYAIKLVKDSLIDTVNNVWRRVAIYWVPYDTLYKRTDSIKHKDTTFIAKMFVRLPDSAWLLWEYPKTMLPMGSR